MVEAAHHSNGDRHGVCSHLVVVLRRQICLDSLQSLPCHTDFWEGRLAIWEVILLDLLCLDGWEVTIFGRCHSTQVQKSLVRATVFASYLLLAGAGEVISISVCSSLHLLERLGRVRSLASAVSVGQSEFCLEIFCVLVWVIASTVQGSSLGISSRRVDFEVLRQMLIWIFSVEGIFVESNDVEVIFCLQISLLCLGSVACVSGISVGREVGEEENGFVVWRLVYL